MTAAAAATAARATAAATAAAAMEGEEKVVTHARMRRSLGARAALEPHLGALQQRSALALRASHAAYGACLALASRYLARSVLASW